MKITDIKTYLVNANEKKDGTRVFANRPRGRNWIFCRITTDQGVYGVGEGGGWPAVVQKGIQELAPILIGEDPFETERLWIRVYDILHGHGLTGAVRGGVMSALDTALWDIKGKALGVPVYQLLGGKIRDRVRLYGHASDTQTARSLMDRGFTAFKCRPSPDVVRDLRRYCGDQIDIGVHGHGEFSPGAALQLATAVEPYHPAFLEEPTSPDDHDALEWLSQRVRVPLSAGERLFHKWAFRDLLQRRAIEIVQPETTRLGGITEAKKLAALAESYLVKMAPHAGSVGPIAQMANVHLLASTSSCIFLEYMAFDVPWRTEVAPGTETDQDGFVRVPDRPGLGVDIDEEAAARHVPFETGELSYQHRTPEEIQLHRPDSWGRSSGDEDS
jgi:galactonate dehydratase